MTIPLSVSKLTAQIKNLIESNFKKIVVQGEISNFKNQQSGHLYFSLKDELAQISSVMFKGNTFSLKQLPKDGDKVIARGELSLYEPRGSYQLIVREIFYLGIGNLLLQFEELKNKLQKMGWFDLARKKDLPQFPKRIGIVTSPTGAAILDILHILNRRLSSYHLILNPVKVQGEGAKEEIAKAIKEMNDFKLCDVMIVGRGGGSLEDLWAFNEEIVAKAIFESKIPIISAVGHECDTTISDLVADKRAPTPSAAAEIVMGEKKTYIDFLEKTRKNMMNTLIHRIRTHRVELKNFLKQPIFQSSSALFSRLNQKLDLLNEDIFDSMKNSLEKKRLALKSIHLQLEAHKPCHEFARIRSRLLFMQKNLNQAISHRIIQKKQCLLRVLDTLIALDPKNLLKKGYTILFSEKNGSLIISSKDLLIGDQLTAKLSDGELKVTIGEIKYK